MEDVEELIQYYQNNQEGLLPYQSQGLELPEPPEGGGVSEHGDNGEPCLECHSQKDEFRGNKIIAIALSFNYNIII